LIVIARRIVSGVAAAGTLCAAVLPASAATASGAYRAGSCTADGDYAVCTASGTANEPSRIYVHVAASPDQEVQVFWSTTCAKGDGAGGRSGQFAAGTPVRRLVRHPYAHPDSCIIAADAQLENGGGWLKAWISYRR
jgi:hypothetical protein